MFLIWPHLKPVTFECFKRRMKLLVARAVDVLCVYAILVAFSTYNYFLCYIHLSLGPILLLIKNTLDTSCNLMFPVRAFDHGI